MLPMLAQIVGLGNLVCLILVLIKMFKDDKIVLGIISIFCGIIAFVIGWQNVQKYNIKNLMIIWTILLITAIALNVTVVMTAGAGR